LASRNSCTWPHICFLFLVCTPNNSTPRPIIRQAEKVRRYQIYQNIQRAKRRFHRLIIVLINLALEQQIFSVDMPLSIIPLFKQNANHAEQNEIIKVISKKVGLY
jgi:hypothetical protein